MTFGANQFANSLRQFIRLFIIVLIPVCSSHLHANDNPISIRVGMYPFAPFVEVDKEGQPFGMTIELLDLLNRYQHQYHFTPVMVSPKRRYQGYQQNDFDAIFYENVNWGWLSRGIDIQATEPYQSGGELYVALKQKGRDQSYFDDLSQRHLVGILGYHYGFANFNSDEKFLKQKFDITLTWTNDKNLKLINTGHGDVAIVTEAYLRRFLRNNPELRNRFLISQRYDQVYSHSILLRPGIKPSIDEMNELIKEVANSAEFLHLLSHYGISPAQKR